MFPPQIFKKNNDELIRPLSADQFSSIVQIYRHMFKNQIA